jgi:2'-5' RNA ligase
MNQTIRTFVCVEIPATVRDRLEQLQRRLAALKADVSWTKKSNLHLTLKFLGHISAAQVESVCRIVQEAASGSAFFDLHLNGTGSFPNQRNPRVLWVGLAEVPQVFKELYNSIDIGLSSIGFPRESRPFAPHLTFARVKSNRNVASLVEALIAGGFQSEPFAIREVVVMKSQLKTSGAIYSPIKIFPLKATQGGA